jgi:hypothetical protein
MRGITKSSPVICAGMFLAFSWLVTADVANARPQYCKAFIGHYTNVAEAGAAKCAICHVGSDKKMRNNYGDALDAALPGKNCKDDAAIKEALVKIEGEKSAVNGKTFGDLLKAGQLPASK